MDCILKMLNWVLLELKSLIKKVNNVSKQCYILLKFRICSNSNLNKEIKQLLGKVLKHRWMNLLSNVCMNCVSTYIHINVLIIIKIG